MEHEVREFSDAGALATAAARYLEDQTRRRVADTGSFHVAVSGGSTPRATFEEWARSDLPWADVVVYQVDERVAADGDPARNATQLCDTLGHRDARVELMPVTEDDLEAAAARYAAQLPEHLDLIHLGLGDDGHTASLTSTHVEPSDAGRLVSVTPSFRGYRRMTMTFEALARAREILWLVSGRSKARSLARLLEGDPSLPATQVRAPRSVVMADRAALEL
jgi:6-phosphogluconolactonase